MKKLIAFLAIVALATPAFGVVIVNEGTGLGIIDVVSTSNGDGSTTWLISINPNTGDDNSPGFIETWAMGENPGEIHQSYLTEGALIGSNGGSQTVKTKSAQDSLASLLPFFPLEEYDVDTDTIFVDDVFQFPVVGGAIDDPQSAPGAPGDGVDAVHATYTSFDGVLGGPIPGNEFLPIWQITTWGPGVWFSGKLQSDGDQDGSFAGHVLVPEPSTLALAGFGLMGLVASMRRRRS